MLARGALAAVQGRGAGPGLGKGDVQAPRRRGQHTDLQQLGSRGLSEPRHTGRERSPALTPAVRFSLGGLLTPVAQSRAPVGLPGAPFSLALSVYRSHSPAAHGLCDFNIPHLPERGHLGNIRLRKSP